MYEGKTREDLYLLLKEKAPNLANGLSRGRRSVLEGLLLQAQAATPAAPPTAQLVKLMRPKVRKPKPKMAEAIPLRIPQEAIDRTKRGLEMLEIAANAIKMSGMSEQQIGALLYVHCGLDAEQAGKAVMGLIGLRASLLGQAA